MSLANNEEVIRRCYASAARCIEALLNGNEPLPRDAFWAAVIVLGDGEPTPDEVERAHREFMTGTFSPEVLLGWMGKTFSRIGKGEPIADVLGLHEKGGGKVLIHLAIVLDTQAMVDSGQSQYAAQKKVAELLGEKPGTIKKIWDRRHELPDMGQTTC
jgi:hypothetical protein